MEDLVKEYGLEESVKRFNQINEYTFYNSGLVEDSEEAQEQPQGDAPQGAEMPQGGEQQLMADPNAQMPVDGASMPPEGGNMGMDGGMPPMDDQGGFGGDGEEIEDIEVEDEQPGDQVIDVDDLTQSQEATEIKVDKLESHLDNVLSAIEKFGDAIGAMDANIENLKAEIEKRNPSQEEKLNLRTLSSAPYSQTTQEYWDKQTQEHPNYKVTADDEAAPNDENKELDITKGDIAGSNYMEIARSFDANGGKLNDYLRF